MMSADGWTTVGVTVACVVAMALNLAAPEFVMVAGLTVLLLAGVVTPEDAFAGFGNPAVLTVMVLFIVAAGVRETGGLDFIGRRVMGRPRSMVGAQLRMMLPVSSLSAFLNNTPVVAMMAPLVSDWAKRNGLSASRLLMPLSYAAIFGGTCTLIGTSTNLVIAAIASSRPEPIEFAMFDVAPLGLVALIAGTFYVLVSSRWLLPDRREPWPELEKAREFTVVMRVQPDSPLVGQNIEEAGLRHLPGLFLAEIQRNGDVLPAVSPTTHIRANDGLLFVGLVDSVVDLRKIPGLVPDTDQIDKLQGTPDRRLVEAVLSVRSPLVGQSVRESRFRSRFNAAIIAIHRQGQRIRSKLGDVELEPGDVLLLETGRGFVPRHRHHNGFALLRELENSEPPRHDRAWLALGILALMVAANTMSIVPLVTAALVAAAAMLFTRCLTAEQARRSLDVSIFLVIASALGIGTALEQSGAAHAIASNLVDAARPFGDIGVIFAVYTATTVLTLLITNNAAAALMFPIAVETGQTTGIDVHTMGLVLMLAASAAFSTPIGYQTNLMVYATGGYKFSDFLRFGLPLQVLLALVTTAAVYVLYIE